MPKQTNKSMRAPIRKVNVATFFWIMGGIAATAAAIVGFGPAYSKIEPITPALSYYVREYTDTKLEKVLAAELPPIKLTQRAQTETLERLLSSQIKRDLYETQRDPTFIKNRAAQDRAQELQKSLDASNKRLEAIVNGVSVGSTK